MRSITRDSVRALRNSLIAVCLVAAGNWAATARAQFSVLYSIQGGAAGYYPSGTLVLSSDGSFLYGTTEGNSSDTLNGGAIFQAATSGGSYTTLFAFSASNGTADGVYTAQAVTLSGPVLYGLTVYGGANGGYDPDTEAGGFGTIFSYNTAGSGTFTSLYSFPGGAGGNNPTGSLVQSGSFLYGVTIGGGLGSTSAGSIFAFNTAIPTAPPTVLYDFTGPPDADPTNQGNSLTLSASGTVLYGLAGYGGANFGGAIYRINTDGSGYSIMHSFDGADGTAPIGALTLAGTNLFGVTLNYGANGDGTIFEIGTDGTGFRTLHAFGGGAGDGSTPTGSLDLSGPVLYGMTVAGGANGLGTIYQINTDGTGYFTLYNFTGAAFPSGADLVAGALVAANHMLYGVTAAGGSAGYGTVFSFGMPITWTGRNSGGATNPSWDTTSASTNWATAYPFAATSYSDGDIVVFSDTDPIRALTVPNTGGLATVVIQAGGVNPALVVFTNTGTADLGVDYSVGGGPIGDSTAGPTGVIVNGNGVGVGGNVYLTSQNTFSGPVQVNAGQLVLENAAATGNSSGVTVAPGAGLALQMPSGVSATFGTPAGDPSSTIPLSLGGAGSSPPAAALTSISGINVYAGPITIGGSGATITSSSVSNGDMLTLTGGIAVAGAATLTSVGPGTTEIDTAPSLGSGAALQVASGTLRFNANSGAASIGTGVTATVATAATLQLAGAVSAFSDPGSGNLVNVANNGSIASGGRFYVTGTNQLVGTVAGNPTATTGEPTLYAGDSVVGDGVSAADLTATQILQNSLTINAGSSVTIAPSEPGSPGPDPPGPPPAPPWAATALASGTDSAAGPSSEIESAVASDSIDAAVGERLENRIAAIERLAATDPGLDLALLESRVLLALPQSSEFSASGGPPLFDAGPDPLAVGGAGSDSAVVLDGELGGGAGGSAGLPAVPEPPTALLAVVAAAALLVARTRDPRLRAPA